jgi:co-chaperonin GroES (HSP10)
MATPIIDNLLLPNIRILVLPDEGETPSTGTIYRRSEMGGGHFVGSVPGRNPIVESDHILFVREMATEVEIDGIEYMVMHEHAVVGVIPN